VAGAAEMGVAVGLIGFVLDSGGRWDVTGCDGVRLERGVLAKATADSVVERSNPTMGPPPFPWQVVRWEWGRGLEKICGGWGRERDVRFRRRAGVAWGTNSLRE